MITMTMRGFLVSDLVVVPKGFEEREVTLTFQRYVIIDAKRQKTGSIEVSMDLFFKEKTLGHDYPQ